ncbi:hypothetical protein A8A01_10085 [Ewingella americana]|nr:hypothetical protein A8A01_10085 [Ewingella americana]
MLNTSRVEDIRLMSAGSGTGRSSQANRNNYSEVNMKKTQEVLLAAVEVAEKIEEIIEARGLSGQEGAVIEALMAAYEDSRPSGFAIT